MVYWKIMDGLLSTHKRNTENWLQFSTITLNNLQEIDNNIEKVQNSQKDLRNTINYIKELSKHAQAKTYVKICPRAYVAALVQHTGEYNVDINSEYQCVLTKDQAVEYIEEQLQEQNGMFEDFKTQKEQLQTRLGLNYEDTSDIPDTIGMPDKIITDKGIAFKQGSFYEIMEIEVDSVFEANKKRISRIKRTSQDLQASDLDININT